MENKRPQKRWRFLAALILLATVIPPFFLLLNLWILTVQYRDEVHNLLNYSDDCHAPCFMGITPGQTTREEVLTILDHHPEVTEYEGNGTGFRVWWKGYDDWSQQANERLTIYLHDNVVDSIGFNDSIPVVAFFGVLGGPDGDISSHSYVYVDEALFLRLGCKSSYISALQAQCSYGFYFVTSDYIGGYEPLEPHRPYLYQDCPYYPFLF